MSSSFHTLEEGMKIIQYLMFLQEPFAFPTSCSLQPLRGGRDCGRSMKGRAGRGSQPSLPHTQRGQRCGEDAQAVCFSRVNKSERCELRVPRTPTVSSDARRNWIYLAELSRGIETQVAEDAVN